jgi:chromate transport protein ChrA
VRRKWLDEKTYVDLVALSQFLPRPTSSKVGIALCGYRAPAMRGRWPPGLVVAFCAIGGAALTFVPFGH